MSAKGVVCVVLALGCALMPPGVRSSSSCHLDEATAIARRTEAIEVQILSKLGITELPQANFSDDHPALETSILRTYHAAVKSVNRRKRRSALDWEDESQDANHDHYYSKTNKVLEIRGEIGKDKNSMRIPADVECCSRVNAFRQVFWISIPSARHANTSENKSCLLTIESRQVYFMATRAKHT